MQVSHSRIECFKNCPYKYKLQYVDKLKTIPDTKPDNALYLGTALHTGLEKDVESALHEYFFSYPVIGDEQITESIKLEYMIEKCKPYLPQGENEVTISSSDFIGFADLIAPVPSERNTYDLYDFKYSNNVKNYMDSPQLHLYKYFFEQTHLGKKIRDMYFFFVPKVTSKKRASETLMQYRQRIKEELKQLEPNIVKIDYDANKVINFLLDTKKALEEKEYSKNDSWLCRYCEYEDFCKKGNDYMILPSTERRKVGETTKRKIWIYGQPMTGKTVMLDSTPNPLNLNTDGNITFVTMPYIAIKDEVTVNGRITNRKLAWDVFKETIAELEKKQNDFKTIIVDLLDDAYENCRLYMYDKLGITHESDDSFKAWDKVRTEFLSTIRRLINMDYENIVLVSHEDTSKDITKKSGDKITSIKTKLPDKVADKVAGMVDIVARAVVEDDGTRTLNFKSNEVVFGGGRLRNINVTTIPLTWDAIVEVYEDANKGANKTPAPAPKPEPITEAIIDETPVNDAPWEEVAPAPEPEEVKVEPKKRTRKRREL